MFLTVASVKHLQKGRRKKTLNYKQKNLNNHDQDKKPVLAKKHKIFP